MFGWLRLLKGASWRNEDGSAALELALLLPILVFLVLGVAEAGHATNSVLTVQTAAREAARLGAQGDADDDALVDLAVIQSERLDGGIPASCSPGSSGVCVDRPTIRGRQAVRVEVCYEHSLILGVPVVFSGPLELCSETTMKVLR